MRIALNARLLHSPDLRGWNRYTVNLLVELTRLDLPIALYTDRPIHEDHLVRLNSGNLSVVVAPSMSYPIWEQVWLPNQCQRDRIDILHSPFNFGLPWSSPCRRVLTLHDAIDIVYRPEGEVPRRPWSISGLKDHLHHAIARTRAHRVITVSAHARGDLVTHLKIPAERIDVIPEAADPRFQQPIAPSTREQVRERHGLASPYLFYIGGWERRKNVPFLIRAFAEASVPGVELVLAGGRQDQRAPLVELAHSLGISESVKLLGWVEEDDLPALYSEALCFVYPSEYEGFGLQLCEAMAVGCPVLAADATSLPEVLGDGGLTFPLQSTTPLSQWIRRLAADSEFHGQLARNSLKRSADFSWRFCAEKTVETYRRTMISS